MNNDNLLESLLEFFGEIPDILTFDETLYDTDLSYILSSI